MVMRRLVDSPDRSPAVSRLKITESLAGLAFVSGVPQVANEAAGDTPRQPGVGTGVSAFRTWLAYRFNAGAA